VQVPFNDIKHHNIFLLSLEFSSHGGRISPYSFKPLSGFILPFIGTPLKNFKVRHEFEITTGAKIWRRILHYEENFKGLSPSTTPLEREDLVRIVDSTIHLIYLLSIQI